jgi:hypothetical protein
MSSRAASDNVARVGPPWRGGGRESRHMRVTSACEGMRAPTEVRASPCDPPIAVFDGSNAGRRTVLVDVDDRCAWKCLLYPLHEIRKWRLGTDRHFCTNAPRIVPRASKSSRASW